MNKLDKILANSAVWFILFTVTYVAIKNFPAAIFIAFLLTVACNRIIIHIVHRRRLTKKMSATDLEDVLSLMGSEQTEFFRKAIPPCFNPVVSENCIELTVNCEKILVFPSYKFSANGLEDVGKFYRTAKAKGAERAVVLGRLTPRNVILFASRLDVEFIFVPTVKVRNFLHSQNALPEKIPSVRKKSGVKKNGAFGEKAKLALNGIFVKKRAKHFLLAGIACATLGLLTPMRIYYCLAAAVALGLAVTCLVKE